MFEKKPNREEIKQNARIRALEFVNYYRDVFSDVDVCLDYVDSKDEARYELSIDSLGFYKDSMSEDALKGYLSGLKFYATEICKCNIETKTKTKK